MAFGGPIVSAYIYDPESDQKRGLLKKHRLCGCSRTISEWSKRAEKPEWLGQGDPTYIDAIGVPRGVPDEYKIADQIAAGWESISFISAIFPVTPNKNLDQINYIHYNIQRLGNYTLAGFEAIREQLDASSLMTFPNRIAVDMLLAEKGGVCSIFGDKCCTFIPNNTAPGGSLSEVISGLRTLSNKMKEHSGVDTSMWDSWMNVFGKYRTLVSSVLVSIAVFASVLTLCGCCCIPRIRKLIERLISTSIRPMLSSCNFSLPPSMMISLRRIVVLLTLLPLQSLPHYFLPHLPLITMCMNAPIYRCTSV
ncbi:uncharacterized protein [Antennarius striatus]|uniref:uncharacterized protein isoform X2 n=1 Tax=Antennarius striatus TaxID=241820 RepID=UPI0035B0A495